MSNNQIIANPQVIRPRVAKVPAKLNTDKFVGIEFQPNNQHLKDAFVVLVGGAGLSALSFTYHHPIGVHQLDAGDWICTPTSDVQSLLDRVERPDQEKIMKLRSGERHEIAVNASLLGRVDGVLLYPGQKTGSRIQILEASKKAAKAAAKARQTAEQIDKKAKIEVGSSDHLNFLGEYRAAELALLALWDKKETKEAVDAKHPFADYETRSGPLADRAQSGVEALNGLSRQAAYDKIIRLVMGRVV